jgi:hypothetical protein
MLIDCDSCRVRGPACGDCVVTVLLGAPPEGVRLDPEERTALDVLAASGLVPPLRLVVLGPPAEDVPAGEEEALDPGVVLVHRHDSGRQQRRRRVG